MSRPLYSLALFFALTLGAVAEPAQRLCQADETSELGAWKLCSDNLYTTKVALTMWWCDHGQSYPESLAALEPDYLVQNFLCPLVGATPYRYERLDDGKGFRVSCTADHGPEGAEEPPSETSDPQTEAELLELKPD